MCIFYTHRTIYLLYTYPHTILTYNGYTHMGKSTRCFGCLNRISIALQQIKLKNFFFFLSSFCLPSVLFLCFKWALKETERMAKTKWSGKRTTLKLKENLWHRTSSIAHIHSKWIIEHLEGKMNITAIVHFTHSTCSLNDLYFQFSNKLEYG